MASVTPRDSLRVTKQQIPAYKGFPNTAISHKPLLVYHSAFPDGASASTIESHLDLVGAVVPQWRYTMYPRTHFHSTTHEVLCISSGSAKLCFGGEENPKRFELTVSSGDVVIVPAGVAHRLLEDYGGFQMVGSYPKDARQWDMCYGFPGEDKKVAGISELGWFQLDPIYGTKGPVHEV